MGSLWVGAWIASLVIGLLVWGLIGWAVVRYRSKDGDNTAPRQTKYHLPLELLYTLVPFLIIGVLFFYTVKAQDAMIEQPLEITPGMRRSLSAPKDCGIARLTQPQQQPGQWLGH